ncbi:cation:proton antiporter [Aquabacterium sp. A7-Y]|uniref:cation:proton antiporter n=1 Tax=Aquabacterium sp. A7-Y TaxID=1349605 RepID=UPI00223E6B9C|nr:cation:proton antiporter [Aquabacterium sp. A7-Y]MCW7538536.1 cation:proton antiporter [Aquabacterium sp. A7-Y]
MDFKFFLALCLCVALPALLGGWVQKYKLFPAVFVQLLTGMMLSHSGAVESLKSHGMDLTQGPLANALNGLGVLGVSLLIAVLASEASPSRGRDGWRFVPISLAGFAVTFCCGAALGVNLAERWPELMGSRQSVSGFAIGVGVATAVTALPVLMSILRDLGMVHTPVGRLAANCACLDDLWLWLGLSAALTLSTSMASLPRTGALLAVYLLVMTQLAPRVLKRLLQPRKDGSTIDPLIVCLGFIFLSAAATDAIGLHAIFGAYVGGAVLPRQAMTGWKEPVEKVSRQVLLPLFFVMTGMALRLDFSDPLFWQLTLAVVAVGVGVKLTVVAGTGRLVGLSWHESVTLGALTQCKGMMELVAINILLSVGLIGRPMFSALAMMAVVSTFATAPMLKLLAMRRRNAAAEVVPQ